MNLVNLRFLSGHYKVPAERIIDLRSRNRGFVAIHADLGGGRPTGKVSDGGKGSGKGKGKGHNK